MKFNIQLWKALVAAGATILLVGILLTAATSGTAAGVGLLLAFLGLAAAAAGALMARGILQLPDLGRLRRRIPVPAVGSGTRTGPRGELHGMDIPPLPPAPIPTPPRYEEAVQHYRGRRYQEARACLKEVKAQLVPGSPAYDSTLGKVHHFMAIVLRQLGENQNAIASYREAIACHERSAERDDIAVFRLRAEIAGTFAGCYRLEEALASIDETLLWVEARPGLSQSARAHAHRLKGDIMFRAGQYKAAVSAFFAALDCYRGILAREERAVAVIRCHLALALCEDGRLRGAEDELRAALETLREQDSWETGRTCYIAGEILRRQFEFDAAKARYDRALKLQKRLRCVHCADTYLSLAALYRAVQDYGEAERNAKEAAALREAAHGSEHPETAACYSALGQLYLAMGDVHLPNAELYLEKAAETQEKQLGEAHPRTALTRLYLGVLHARQGRLADSALPALEKAGETLAHVYGGGHPIMSEVYQAYAEIRLHRGERREAADWLVRAAEIMRDSIPVPPWLSGTREYAADLYFDSGSYDEARKYYYAALDLIPQDDQYSQAVLKKKIGVTALYQQDFSKARIELLESYELLRGRYADEARQMLDDVIHLLYQDAPSPREFEFFTGLWRREYQLFHPLEYIVLMEVGDSWYENNDFGAALDFYQRARELVTQYPTQTVVLEGVRTRSSELLRHIDSRCLAANDALAQLESREQL